MRRLALLLLPLLAAPALGAGLPGGASALNEAHGDWLVNCRLDATGNAACSVTQQQTAQQNGQRVLAIELKPNAVGGVSGLLVMPFGLALASGVTLGIDGMGEAKLGFRTCLPAGCLVDIGFDAAALEVLRQGKALDIRATADGGQETKFAVSLNGLASALDRVAAILEP